MSSPISCPKEGILCALTTDNAAFSKSVSLGADEIASNASLSQACRCNKP